MDPVIAHIRKDLKASVDPATQASFQRFFKESVKLLRSYCSGSWKNRKKILGRNKISGKE